MLCWICPDCGRDCSPAVRECPSCAQGQAAVTNAVLSMVEQLRAVPLVPLLAAAPQQYLLFGLTNGHSGGHSPATTETSVLTEEDPAVPAGETIDSRVRPLVEAAKAAPAAPPPPPKFVELPAPLRPPENSAPLIESRTPTA